MDKIAKSDSQRKRERNRARKDANIVYDALCAYPKGVEHTIYPTILAAYVGMTDERVSNALLWMEEKEILYAAVVKMPGVENHIGGIFLVMVYDYDSDLGGV